MMWFVWFKTFFILGSLHHRLNSNLMALIPKADNAVKVGHFRSIATGNFVFKLITRIIVDRLGCICDKILSPYQFGFGKGRNGCEAIVGAAECFS